MRKLQGGTKGAELSQCGGRVLARMLAEDLGKTHGGSGIGFTNDMNTVTNLGDGYDITYKGNDAY